MGANCSGSLIRKKTSSVYYELFTKKCWFICSKKGNTLVTQAIFFHFVVCFQTFPHLISTNILEIINSVF